jgi:hypothetical protein
MIRVIKCLTSAVVFFVTALLCHAQSTDSLVAAEERLGSLFERISQVESDTEKEQLCEDISDVFDEMLLQPSSFKHSFDSLKNLGKVYSPDGRLRFYTWNLPLRDGTNRFYGMLQFKPDHLQEPLVFRLTDAGDQVEDVLQAVASGDNWYGSLVYEITQFESLDTTYYILLGFAPFDLFTSQKIIDILYFRPDIIQDKTRLQPVFGKPVFLVGNKLQCRVVFEYSARVQMTLQWADQAEMIIFDHLSPLNPSYTGNYQFYGPDFSYDGFVFEKGVWRLMEDIDIRNILE